MRPRRAFIWELASSLPSRHRKASSKAPAKLQSGSSQALARGYDIVDRDARIAGTRPGFPRGSMRLGQLL